jgi:hypothetical protein
MNGRDLHNSRSSNCKQVEVNAVRKTFMILFIGVGLMVLGTVHVGAHHAFSAEFDGNKPIQLTGTVTKMEWINPHAWIHIDVKKSDGTVENWMIEGGTPNVLIRRGLRKTDLPAGTVIVVQGFRAKDGGLRANGQNLTLPDGRQLLLGSSAPGAP